MGTFAITDSGDLLNAVNYAISNLGSTTAAIANTILTVDTNTNAVTIGTGGQIYSYNVPYINIRYANNATGTNGFTSSPTNSFYYGIQASAEQVPATVDNPASYNWNQVAGAGFSTTNYLFYQTPGGRQITFDIAATAQNASYLQTVNGQAINIDFVSTIAANVVTANTIANGAITGSQIASNTVTGYNIATNTITATNIAPNTITGSKIAPNTITSTNITSYTIQASDIANATITSTQIAANTITGTNLLNATITGSKIGTNTVTGTNIGVQTVTANNIANSTITGQQLAGNIAISTTGNVTAGYHIGNGSLLTNINGNSVGSVAQANYANIANSVSGSNVSGSVAQANYANTANSVAGANVSGTVANAIYAITAGSVTSSVTQANYANIANSVSGSNVFGSIAQADYANTANAVTGGNVSGQVANALIAGTVYTADQPNITSVGLLTNVSSSGTVTGNAFIAAPVAFATLTAAPGARAFVNNANLAAANNFGQQISGGASNTVPVWSDGTYWYIG